MNHLTSWIHIIISLIIVVPVVVAEIIYVVGQLRNEKKEQEHLKEQEETHPRIPVTEIKGGYIKERHDNVLKPRKKRKAWKSVISNIKYHWRSFKKRS